MSGTQAATVDDIVRAAITELSQVPGQATQIYSTPRLQQYVQNAVLMEIEEKWWNALMFYLQVSVDGTTGIPTTDLVSPLGGYVDEYADIAAVFPEGSDRPFKAFPRKRNPYTMVGQTSRFYISPAHGNAHRPFSIWPPAAQNVVVFARHRPVLPMSSTDRIWLDRVLILYDVCWMYAVDDGTIPAQVNKFQVLATNRRRRMKAAEEVHGVPLNGGDDYDAPIGGHDDSFFVLDKDPLA